MTVYAILQLDGTMLDASDNYEIAAFCGDECRGVASIETIESTGTPYFYLRVRSNVSDNEIVTLKCYDKTKQCELELDTTIDFESQGVKGFPSKPLVLTGAYRYKIEFVVDGKVVKTDTIKYGAAIPALPQIPTKEGYTFSGWSEVPETMPAKDVIINGTYIANKYTLTFTADGKTVQTGEVAYGTKITAPEAPAKEGYTFDGWKDVPATMPAKAVTINGTYTVNNYTVTFKIGEEVIFTKSMAYGTKITAPEAPAKEGHTFDGWGEVAATVPAKDVTYVGTYTVNKYTLTFTADGKTVQTGELAYGTKIVAPEAPAKDGYTFDGWKDVPATMPAKAVTINGTYTINNYTVTFKIGDEVIFTKSMAYGTAIVAPEAPAKEGHTFAGWGEVAATVPAKDVTYVGTYTVNKYTLTFTADGKTVQTGEVAYGTKIVAPEAPAKEGHTFDGWKDVPATMPAKAVTINGTYTINNYTVTFKIGDEVIFTKSMAYGTKITAPEAPAKEGHTFAGWGEVAATVPAKDVTYEGTYTVNKYTLTFTADGKTVQTGEVAYGTKIVAPEAPAKEGHTFDGWKDVPATMPAKAVTINGTYTVNDYTVTFKIGDEVIFTKSMAYGTAIVAPEAPAKEGHTFAGWGEVAATVPAKDVTYVGTYTVNKYTLTFTADGKTVQTGEVAYGTKITAPEAPAKEGHTFDGWKDVPATMPAKAVTINGTYTVNNYTVTFKIGEEVIFTKSMAYGTAIVAPEAPAKEGHTFAGWGEVAETVPANDVTYEGTYTANSYIVTYVVDGEVYKTESVVYGAQITAITAPEKVGYTFSGWSEIPATMPAEEVKVYGTFAINSYLVTFKIGDEVIYSESLPYGTEITAPEAPAKEGHTFNGWGEVAATVPASDVTYEGTYTVNNYTVTFKIEGEVIYSESLPYGSKITAPEAPAKEGHTFNGWGEVAATVPASDVTYEGTYTVNVYNVYYYVGEELVHTAEVAYGEAIPEYTYEPTIEGDVFVGWIGETYETMPAHDVTYTANIKSGIDQLLINNGQLTNFDLTGRKVTDTENLKGGIYIINGKKVVIK